VFDLLPSFGRLNPRLAVFLMMVLLMGAAIPLVLGWIKILPAEREPFSRPDEAPPKRHHDFFSVFLLVNISFSFLAAVPRIAETFHLDWLAQLLPASWADHAAMIFLIWLVFVPALAAAYSAVRPNPIRTQLILGGVLVLALWLLSPTLLGSLATTP
jgi:hypothetical protein